MRFKLVIATLALSLALPTAQAAVPGTSSAPNTPVVLPASTKPVVKQITPEKVTPGKQIVVIGNNLSKVSVFIDDALLKVVSQTRTKVVVLAPKVIKTRTVMLSVHCCAVRQRAEKKTQVVQVKKEVK